MTKKSADAPKNVEPEKPAIGIVLEFEFMLFPGRRLMFEAFSNVLKSHSVALDQVLFSRYCLNRTIEKSVQSLLAAAGKKGATAADIAARIKRQFESSMKSADTAPCSAVLGLLKKAVESDIKIGLLSFLPEETLKKIMERLPADQISCLHIMKKEALDLPTPDGWLSLLKSMSLSPRRAIALVEGALACKSVLAVGMRCVVIPDAFTAWQDFVGADIVLEKSSDLKLNDLVALLTPSRFRGAK